MKSFTFLYRGIEYDTLEDAEYAVEQEVGSTMNNIDPASTEEYVDALDDIDVFKNGDYWGTYQEYLMWEE